MDGDGDVDLVDVGAFQRCFTGPAAEAIAACTGFDVDGCGSIELEDFGAFKAALTGPSATTRPQFGIAGRLQAPLSFSIPTTRPRN